jgi:hypothetical protein
MSGIKRLYEQKQQEFAEHKFTKDGCPADEAKKESWDSMVEHFFDNDEDAALDEFNVWILSETVSTPDVCVQDPYDLQEQKESREEALRWENRDMKDEK